MMVMELIAELEKLPKDATIATYYLGGYSFIPTSRIPVQLVNNAEPWGFDWYGFPGEKHGTNRRDPTRKPRTLVVVG